MIGEINFAGVFVPSLVVWSCISLFLLLLLKRVLAHFGFYRHLWHRVLFNFSLFVILLGGIVFLVNLT